MALSLWIPSSLQYVTFGAGEARRGASRQAVAQAIKRFLFKDVFTATPSGAPLTYDRALRQFSETLGSDLKIGPQWPGARRLWRALVPAPGFADRASNPSEPSPSGDSDAGRPVKVVSDHVESLFCHALHTLCASLAKQSVVDSSLAQDDDSEEESGDDNADESFMPGIDPSQFAVEYAEVLNALASQLRWATWQWQRDLQDEEQPEANDWRTVAAVLLDTLMQALGDWFRVQTGETYRRLDRPHTLKVIAVRHPELAQRIDGLLTTLPLRFTAQPLKEPVAYRFDDPGPTDDAAATCIRIDLIGYRQTNAFLRRAHRDIRDPKQRPPAFKRYIAAVNLQQAVPWRINRALLQWTRALITLSDADSGAGTSSSDLDGLGAAMRAELSQWVRNQLYRPKRERPKNHLSSRQDPDSLRARSAEFLDSPLASRALDELCPRVPQSEPPAFYLPWKADYRGRIYPETPWLSPQGGDLQRALLELARGQVLTTAGASALRRHGANLVNRSRLLADLGIKDRPVLTLDERERWVVEHEAAILACAASQLGEPFWREVADEPMQFLAFCLAYRQWTLHPEAPVHMPVQIDGTCNGLQHIAALTGDVALAQAVNVLPGAQDLPADIYSELAAAARGALGEATAAQAQNTHGYGLELADAWLAADLTRRDWINRKTAKKVVMTIPYGAGRRAQARGVLEAIEDEILRAWRDHPPAESALGPLIEWKNEHSERRAFVAQCSRNLFTAARKAAFAEGDALTTALARAEWERLRTLGAYVALALVERLHAALNGAYPGVKAFSDWLGQCASACAGTNSKKNDNVGLPLLWLTPLGFPVVQNKFKFQGTSVTAKLGGKSIRLDIQRLGDDLDPDKQRNALLPNFIHGLDATHLALTLLEANQRGVPDIGSIHDCLLCHPNDAEALSGAVRATFASLYAPDGAGLPAPLGDWNAWMKQVIELRTLPYRGRVIGALEQPDGLGERVLQHDADQGKADAIQACKALAVLRSCAPPQRFLLGLLLERAVVLPTPKKPPRLPTPPTTKALRLSEDSISAYFFS